MFATVCIFHIYVYIVYVCVYRNRSVWNLEIHRYREYSLEEHIGKGLEGTGNGGYFWRKGRTQDRGVFKADSGHSCSILIFNEDNVFMFTCEIKH